MAKSDSLIVPLEQLRWRLDPASLPFAATSDLDPLDEIIGQQRGVDAFKFGMGMDRKGYNIFVTGAPGTGRLATIKKLLGKLLDNGGVPDDLCYVNNFKQPESPILLRFDAGQGSRFKKAMHGFVDAVKRDAPQLFQSEEYIARKREIAEAHEREVRDFFKAVEEKVKDTGLAVVGMQMGGYLRPDLLPIIDGEPTRLVDLEELVERGRFPREEFERLKKNREDLKDELDQIVKDVRALQKDVADKHAEVDRLMFLAQAREAMAPLLETFPDEKVQRYLLSVLDNMVENLDDIKSLGAKPPEALKGLPMMAAGPSPDAVFHPYKVNLLVNNEEQSGQPVIIENYPNYRNLFGSIERMGDRMGGWHTDFTRIKAGSFVKANGGYLVLNLLDAILEPGVWQTLKRSLKTEKIEIETYDPYYFLTATGLKPESIAMDVKVVCYADAYLYHMLRHYDEDVAKIFKVRADYESSMDKTDDTVQQMARFIRTEVDRNKLRHFDASGVAALVEEAVRMAGRQEKLSTSFSILSDLLAEADYHARVKDSELVTTEHVNAAIQARVHRSNQIEERIQEMIDRGTLFVDTTGSAVGQINGLAVYSMGDLAFGKPSRITVTTAMGKDGIINIEREADMSGPTHSKGVHILAGYLRRTFAQDRPMTLTASIAFEQSYGGIDGDSASSTELYALLSSLAEIPLRQDIAVTGSVNQKGEVQPIGGVNEKIEGFYLCCKHTGLTGDQGVMIPQANVKDLMLRSEVIQAVQDGQFHIWSVKTIDQGIELLTGAPAGKRTKSGTYTKNSVYNKVDTKLRTLAEGLRDFAKAKDNED